MNACLIAVGSEMLTPFRVDTYSLVVTERLNQIGYDVRLKAVVADHVDELARVLEGALAWADVIILTGGLGPPRGGAGLGGCDHPARRFGPDRGRHHARCRGPRAEPVDGRGRADCRSHP